MSETKNLILRAALRLFLQKGYRDVTMKDILESTGLAKGTFYYHFESKDNIFEEAAKFFFTNYLIVNFSRLSNESLDAFYHSYLKQKEKAAKQMNELGDTINIYIFMNQAYMRMKSLEELMEHQKEKECEAWLSIIKKAKEAEEIRVDLPDDRIVSLFIHSMLGVRSNQMRNDQNNLEAVEEIKKDWDSIYCLIKK